MPTPFSCGPVICEWLGKKTRIEKKKKNPESIAGTGETTEETLELSNTDSDV